MKQKWTLDNVPDLKGKVIIVTGANSGLGFASVQAFLEHGATVIMACRSKVKGDLARRKLEGFSGQVFVMKLDLSRPDSISRFTKAFLRKFTRLDVLLNNAGVMRRPFELSPLGVESQLSTNHLGHFMLTARLLNLIANTPKSRVVSVSSLAHRKGHLQLEDINYHDGDNYEPMEAYRRSKLANLFFAYQLQRYFEVNGVDAISVAAHPGIVPTNLINHTLLPVVQFLVRPVAEEILQKVNIGALGQIRAAVDPQVCGAEFYGPSGIKEWRGAPILVESSVASHDEILAQQLWYFSQEVTGCQFILKKDSER